MINKRSVSSKGWLVTAAILLSLLSAPVGAQLSQPIPLSKQGQRLHVRIPIPAESKIPAADVELVPAAEFPRYGFAVPEHPLHDIRLVAVQSGQAPWLDLFSEAPVEAASLHVLLRAVGDVPTVQALKLSLGQPGQAMPSRAMLMPVDALAGAAQPFASTAPGKTDHEPVGPVSAGQGSPLSHDVQQATISLLALLGIGLALVMPLLFRWKGGFPDHAAAAGQWTRLPPRINHAQTPARSSAATPRRLSPMRRIEMSLAYDRRHSGGIEVEDLSDDQERLADLLDQDQAGKALARLIDETRRADARARPDDTPEEAAAIQLDRACGLLGDREHRSLSAAM